MTFSSETQTPPEAAYILRHFLPWTSLQKLGRATFKMAPSIHDQVFPCVSYHATSYRIERPIAV